MLSLQFLLSHSGFLIHSLIHTPAMWIVLFAVLFTGLLILPCLELTPLRPSLCFIWMAKKAEPFFFWLGIQFGRVGAFVDGLLDRMHLLADAALAVWSSMFRLIASPFQITRGFLQVVATYHHALSALLQWVIMTGVYMILGGGVAYFLLQLSVVSINHLLVVILGVRVLIGIVCVFWYEPQTELASSPSKKAPVRRQRRNIVFQPSQPDLLSDQ